jgi:hypothetical protein
MSKFSELFKEAKSEQSPTPAPKRTEKKSVPKKETKTPPSKKDQPTQRATGRRSDPNYIGAFAYIPAQLHKDVRRELFGRDDLDFSGLVEQLLSEWIKKQK